MSRGRGLGKQDTGEVAKRVERAVNWSGVVVERLLEGERLVEEVLLERRDAQ